MSLALNAAPFNDESNNDNDYLNTKRKQLHNRTQKRYVKESVNNQKVNSVLETIHNNSSEEDENNQMGDFNPPPKPESSGVSKTVVLEKMTSMSDKTNQNMFRTLGRSPQPNYDGDNNLEMNDYSNYGDDKSIDKYYKEILPGYDPLKVPTTTPYYNTKVNLNSQSINANDPDVVLKKINYMISLLEDQQDERTNNVTEEVVLYSFLGIFIIFVIDSFVKVGKYVR
jgi:hypothetical protein